MPPEERWRREEKRQIDRAIRPVSKFILTNQQLLFSSCFENDLTKWSDLIGRYSVDSKPDKT